VTVRNGSLPRWGLGVDHEGASHALIQEVGIGPGTSAVRIRGGADIAIRSSGLPGGRFGSGLLVDGSDGLVVADSTGNKWSVTGNLARIVRNELGSGAQFSTCLRITGSGNLLKENKVDGCESGSIVVTAGVDNVLIDNEAFGSDSFVEGDESDGIRVAAATSGTLLRGNFTHDNADDGIDVQSASTRLKDNRADDNGDFGIDAVAGVKDLGGNTASGNGNPLQCRNVFCQ
jgi:hypothetical protein